MIGAAPTPPITTAPLPPLAQPPSAAAAWAPPAAQPRICPSCGAQVPAEFAFCGACGTRFAPPAAAPAAAEAAGTAAAAAAAAAAAGRTLYFQEAPRPVQPAPRGKLVLVRPDGCEGGTHPLVEGENRLGRGHGPLFDPDSFLSPQHTEIIINAAGMAIRDLHSLNGVFVRMTQEEEIENGDIFRVGQELLRFDTVAPASMLEDGTEVMGSPDPGYWGRLCVIVGREEDGSAFPLLGDAVVMGRERGDILFPEDGYVSATHCRISYRGGRFYLADLGSSNGTYLRVRGERQVASGTLLLMGQQLFRLAML